jgi:hypothetical protein
MLLSLAVLALAMAAESRPAPGWSSTAAHAEEVLDALGYIERFSWASGDSAFRDLVRVTEDTLGVVLSCRDEASLTRPIEIAAFDHAFRWVTDVDRGARENQMESVSLAIAVLGVRILRRTAADPITISVGTLHLDVAAHACESRATEESDRDIAESLLTSKEIQFDALSSLLREVDGLFPVDGNLASREARELLLHFDRETWSMLLEILRQYKPTLNRVFLADPGNIDLAKKVRALEALETKIRTALRNVGAM